MYVATKDEWLNIKYTIYKKNFEEKKFCGFRGLTTTAKVLPWNISYSNGKKFHWTFQKLSHIVFSVYTTAKIFSLKIFLVYGISIIPSYVATYCM